MLEIFDNTCILLAKAEQKHFQYTREILNEYNLGITPVQMLVLYTLFKQDAISLTDLGKRSYLDASTLTGVIDRLGEAGLVTREGVPGDRRAYNVCLTEKARSIKDKIAAASRKVYDTMLHGCSPDEIANFRKVLLNIYKNLS